MNIMFKISTNLHYSQTFHSTYNETGEFKISTNLHYSQTQIEGDGKIWSLRYLQIYTILKLNDGWIPVKEV